jgi:hypothetical protein
MKRRPLAPCERRRILVLGYLIRMPLGGLTWHYLQFATGLQALGHDVYYLEDSCFFEDDERAWFYDPVSATMGADPANGLRFARDVFDRSGLAGRWALFDHRQSRWVGPASGSIRQICATADALLNVSAANPLRAPLDEIPVRVFIDTDPLFSQLRIATNPIRRRLALQHNRFFTLGENIPSGRSTVPCDGIAWQATRQPILIETWPTTPGPVRGPFTTLMAWDSFAAEEHAGVRYGMKSSAFQPFMDLPRRTGADLVLGLFDPVGAPDELRANGWTLRDGKALTSDPWAYQAFVSESKAEFSVAKAGYVASRCGWFSDRTATYLASGRPAVVQDTGFSDWLETGLGVVPFQTPDEASAAIADVNRRYESHCRAARELAEHYFDARRVLTRLLDAVDDRSRTEARVGITRVEESLPNSPKPKTESPSPKAGS